MNKQSGSNECHHILCKIMELPALAFESKALDSCWCAQQHFWRIGDGFFLIIFQHWIFAQPFCLVTLDFMSSILLSAHSQHLGTLAIPSIPKKKNPGRKGLCTAHAPVHKSLQEVWTNARVVHSHVKYKAHFSNSVTVLKSYLHQKVSAVNVKSGFSSNEQTSYRPRVLTPLFHFKQGLFHVNLEVKGKR